MSSYIDFKKFFLNDRDRTIDNLSKVYSDKKLLHDSIKEVMLPHLTPEQIRGRKILLKPNLVRECNPKKPYDKVCLFTHPNFILATLKVILECSPETVTIGDAPIQNCHWEEMLTKDFYDSVDSLSKEFAVPVKVVDFRKVIFYPKLNESDKSDRKDGDYIIFDVADRSWLEPITKEKNIFRVTNYDPDRMAQSHGKGKHRYCVAKEVFDADIVITMPKTKTHRMACLTNSLKILVGINGDKDYLPHHRIGSQEHGGDCYKDYSPFRSAAERLLDFSNRHHGAWYFRVVRLICAVLWKLSRPSKETSTNAGWWGNDTVWRMVLDLNTIVEYGKSDGTLANNPQRTIYTLCDAIVGGQNSGPLDPDPLAMGFIAFSNDPYLCDEMFGRLFRIELERVPLLREAAKLNESKEKHIYLDGGEVTADDITKFSTDVVLAPGWVNYNRK